MLRIGWKSKEELHMRISEKINFTGKSILLVIVFIFLAFALTACIPGDGTYTNTTPAGFFWGVWHGWIAPVSLIISIFNDNISIYEVNNTGFFYDLGFYMAVISGFGGIALSRRKKTQVKYVSSN